MGYFQLFGTNNTATNILVHMSFCTWAMFFKINFGHTALFICLSFYYPNFVELWSLCLQTLVHVWCVSYVPWSPFHPRWWNSPSECFFIYFSRQIKTHFLLRFLAREFSRLLGSINSNRIYVRHRSRVLISQGRSFKSKPKQRQTYFLVLLLSQWTGFPLIYAFPEAVASENASIKQGPHSNSLSNAAQGLMSCSPVGMKARAPGLLRLPPSCPPHLPLHQSPHNYPTSVQEPAAHPLSTMAFGSLLISGAWWFSSPACTLGCSFTRIFVMFYLGTCGRKFDVYPTFSYSPFLPGLPRDSYPHCWLSIHKPQYPLGKTGNHSLQE